MYSDFSFFLITSLLFAFCYAIVSVVNIVDRYTHLLIRRGAKMTSLHYTESKRYWLSRQLQLGVGGQIIIRSNPKSVQRRER